MQKQERIERRRVREVGRVKVNGPAVAAILAAMLGPLIMGVVNVGTVASADFSNLVLSIGKLWIPSAQGIGPYSGKETFLLAGWLVSWGILHMTLRKKDMHLTIPMVVFMVGMLLATLFVYTPFIHLILGK